MEKEIKKLTAEERLTALELKSEVQESLINEQAKTIEGLESKVAGNGSVSVNKKDEPLTVPTEKFEVEGVEYTFKYAAFRVDGEKLVAKNILKDTGILTKIVKEHPDLVVKA